MHAKHQSVRSPHKNAQSGPVERPKNGILIGVLKAIEGELGKRGMLKAAAKGDVVSPLWFLAETERNVYLWRRGFSLHDEGKFEFWVCPEKLIEKHLAQLRSKDTHNPFVNPLWGVEAFDHGIVQRQMDYFEELQDRLVPIIGHATALSHVTTLVQEEIRGKTERELVVLPAADGKKVEH